MLFQTQWHLGDIQVTVKEYFPSVVEGFQCTEPVYVPSHRAKIIKKQYEELRGTSTDTALEGTHTDVLLISLHARLKVEFPHMSGVGVKELLPFPSTYLNSKLCSQDTQQ
jgi:hypothetical protein